MPKVSIIDDDYAAEALAENLRHRGYEVERIKSAGDALSAIDAIAKSDLVILDIIMEYPKNEGDQPASGGQSTGMLVWRRLREHNSKIPILVLSGTQNQDLIETLASDPYTEFISKWNTPKLADVVARIEFHLGMKSAAQLPKSFIIHGHDEKAKLELKNYLQNVMGLPEPIILHEQPNLGRTIIEKFQDYASVSHLAFAILTPDDQVLNPNDPNDVKRRARQNVILELGYFLGVLGRKGRVFLLYKGPLELPSDLSGVIYIDISNGVEAAGEQLRRELKHVIG